MSCSCQGSNGTAVSATAIYDAEAFRQITDRGRMSAQGRNYGVQRLVARGGRIAYLAHTDDGETGEFHASLKGIPVRVEYKVTWITKPKDLPKVEVEVKLTAYIEGIPNPVFAGTVKLTCNDVTQPHTCRISTSVDRTVTPDNPSVLGCDFGCIAGCAGGICTFCFDLGAPPLIAVCVAGCAFFCWWDCC